MWRAHIWTCPRQARSGEDDGLRPARGSKRASPRSRNVLRVLVTGCALHLVLPAAADNLARGPVRLDTWLTQAACSSTQGGVQLSPEIALGLVAFNSPYLFGGKALQSQLTCGACHATEGPSGAAVRLRLRKPVPDLGTVGTHVDVASFAGQAVEHEFDGPPLAPRTAEALAALVDVLAPHTTPRSVACPVDGASLLAIGLRLCAKQTYTAKLDADEVDFIRDSLRFFIGELARTAPPEIPGPLLAETNRVLHAADLQTKGCGTPAMLTRLARRWEKRGARPPFRVGYPRIGNHE